MSEDGTRTSTIREDGAATVRQEPVPGLIVLHSQSPGLGDGLFPLQPELTIGRSPDCAVFLEDPGLSRRHAALSFSGGRLSVKDTGSHNGTFIDGRRLGDSAAPLPFGALLRCGQALMTPVPDIRPHGGWRAWGLEPPLVGGPALREIREEIRTFAATGLEVLVLGESGTGKELVAGEVHRESGRPGRLVVANCAELPESLFEAELFGAARGAYTGASRDRAGLLQSAHRGTLFLDEVTELPLPQQAKLLRVVEQQEVRPLGQSRSVKLDLRLVAATNRELAEEVKRGAFRADLFHRLRGAEVRLPPLRERRWDIPLLVQHLLPGDSPRPSVVTMELLLRHPWPGNVRELDRSLREAAARAAAHGAELILPNHLRPELQDGGADEPDPFDAVRRALAAAGGNVARAAEALGVSRPQVYKLLKERGLTADDFRR